MIMDAGCSQQESFTLEKYVEKLAQLNPETGLGPLHKNKDESKPFDPEVRRHLLVCVWNA